jgi:ERCC4-related helicase
METGKGKTYISVMLINHLFQKGPNKKVIYLVCEGSLVEQQYLVIKNNTPDSLRIKQFIGGKTSTLLSDPNIFRKVWKDYDVFISTPSIVHKILTVGYLMFSEIDLLVFDECHHTDKDHPYNLLMLEYYYYYKNENYDIKFPQILGLTASPLKKKIENDILSSATESLTNLAENLDCDFVIDPELYSMNEVDSLNSTSMQSYKETEEYVEVECHLACSEYEEASDYIYDNLFVKLIDLCFKNNTDYMGYRIEYEMYVKKKLNAQDLMEFNQVLCEFKYLYEFRKTSFLFGVLEQVHRQIFMLLENVNLEAVKDLVYQYSRLYQNNRIEVLEQASKKREFKDLNRKSLEDLINIFRDFKINNKLKYESHRLRELLRRVIRIMKEDAKAGAHNFNYEGRRMIIFVCNRVVSEYLCKLINDELDEEVNFMPNYKKFKCVNVVGINSKTSKSGFNSKNSISSLNKNLEKFKSGEAQILIGTSTIEEGLDVKQCDVVIVYTDLRTAKSYIQMKGRARKENARFVIFTHDKERTQEHINDFINLIKVMRLAFKNSIVGDFKRQDYIENRKLTCEYLFMPSTHAKLTMKNVSAIFNEIKNQFISKKRNFVHKIECEQVMEGKTPKFKAIMYVEKSKDLPPSLYTKPIQSKIYSDKTSATNCCMLMFLAHCCRFSILDDHFRLS